MVEGLLLRVSFFFVLQGTNAVNIKVNQRLVTLGAQWEAKQQCSYYSHIYFL